MIKPTHTLAVALMLAMGVNVASAEQGDEEPMWEENPPRMDLTTRETARLSHQAALSHFDSHYDERDFRASWKLLYEMNPDSDRLHSMTPREVIRQGEQHMGSPVTPRRETD